MRHIVRLALIAVLLSSGGALAQTQPVPPQRSALPTPVIMVVDPQAAVQKSLAGIAIRQQHDKLLQGFDADLQAGRKTLGEAEAELSRKKATMSVEEWQKQAQEFNQRVAEFNQKFQKINLAVDKSYRTAMTELGRAFTEVTAQVAAESGVNLVLPIQQVVLHDPRMDLTKSVLDLLDKKYPSIVFPPPEVDAEPTAKVEPAKPTRKK